MKGRVTKTGYKKNSPDVKNDYNIIPSGRITMQDVEFPVYGVDNLGNAQMMYPGAEYEFPGNMVFELPMAQKGKEVIGRNGVRNNPDGSVSTHLMAREYVPNRGWVAFPTLFQNPDSTWVEMDMSNGWGPVYNEAVKRGEVYDFGEDEQAAIKFADEGSWKKEERFQGGGDSGNNYTMSFPKSQIDFIEKWNDAEVIDLTGKKDLNVSTGFKYGSYNNHYDDINLKATSGNNRDTEYYRSKYKYWISDPDEIKTTVKKTFTDPSLKFLEKYYKVGIDPDVNILPLDRFKKSTVDAYMESFSRSINGLKKLKPGQEFELNGVAVEGVDPWGEITKDGKYAIINFQPNLDTPVRVADYSAQDEYAMARIRIPLEQRKKEALINLPSKAGLNNNIGVTPNMMINPRLKIYSRKLNQQTGEYIYDTSKGIIKTKVGSEDATFYRQNKDEIENIRSNWRTRPTAPKRKLGGQLEQYQTKGEVSFQSLDPRLQTYDTDATYVNAGVINDPYLLSRNEAQIVADESPQQTVSSYEEPSTITKVLDRAAHPFATMSYVVNNQKIPDRVGEGFGERAASMDFASSFINPADIAYYGIEGVKDIFKGNYASGAINVLGAVPSIIPSGVLGRKVAQEVVSNPTIVKTVATSPYTPKFAKPSLLKRYRSQFPTADIRGAGTGNYSNLGINELGLRPDDFASLTNYERSAISEVNQFQPADDVFNTFVQRYADFNTDDALADMLANYSRKNPRTKFEINLGRNVEPSKRMQEIFDDPSLNVNNVFSFDSKNPITVTKTNQRGRSYETNLFNGASARDFSGEFEKNLRSYGQEGFYAANVPTGKPVRQALTHNSNGVVFDYTLEELPVADFVVNKGLMKRPDNIRNLSRFRGKGDMANQHNFLLGITNSPSIIVSGNKGFAGLEGANAIRKKIGGLKTPIPGKTVPAYNEKITDLLQQEFQLSKPFEGTFIKSPGVQRTYYNSKGEASAHDWFYDNDEIFTRQTGGELDKYQKAGEYKVASGDTFYGIANRQGVDKQALLDANPGLDIENLKAGQSINLPNVITPNYVARGNKVVSVPNDIYAQTSPIFKSEAAINAANRAQVKEKELSGLLDLNNTLNYLVSSRGNTPEFWTNTADTIAHHESWHTMDPKTVQANNGPAKGMFQFEGPAFETFKRRYQNVANSLGLDTDPNILNANSADQLTAEQQYTAFLVNLIESDAVLKDYADGKMSIEDLWLTGHKNVEAKGDRASFQESLNKARKEGIKGGYKDFKSKGGQSTPSYDKYDTLERAWFAARKELGKGKVFMYGGEKHTTLTPKGL